VNGRLLLVPNALDLGAEEGDLRDVIADGVLRHAAVLTHWVVEDARSARAFLKRVGQLHALTLPLQSIAIEELPRPRKGSHDTVSPEAWRALLSPTLQGHDVGLLSEAGLPAVADPGAGLVQAAHDMNITVWPLAGASSLLLALAGSGLNGQSFAFVGYLPQDTNSRAARVRELEQLSRRLQQTQLIIETPYRNEAMLSSLLAILAPSTRLSISIGLTLPTGWVRCQTVAQWRAAPPQLSGRVPAVFALLA
jgi:16S rRNA (cytidine1402-2'-O)-methyltransferase